MVDDLSIPVVIEKQVHFINFQDFGYRNPIYFNIQMEPMRQFVSSYKLLRSNKEMFLRAKQEQPHVFRQDIVWEKFRDKKLEDCVMDENDYECNYQAETIRDGPIV